MTGWNPVRDSPHQRSRIADAYNNPQRVRPGSPYGHRAYRRYRGTAPALDGFVRPDSKEPLACHPQATPHYLVVDPASSGGDFDLGVVLSVVWLPPNAESAFYFSGVTYTSLGYGDVVLAKPWRLLAPIEGLVGVMMCGLSTGYFFVVVSRIHQWKPLKSAEVPISEKTQA
jgi:hypothetical protein